MARRSKELPPSLPLVAGAGWPALPRPREAAVLALMHQLEQSQWWPAATLRALQFRQAEALLAHAVRTVPYYEARLGAVRGLPAGALGEQAWQSIPLLTRRALQETGNQVESRALPKGHGPTAEVVTSGSTGRPVRVLTTVVTGLIFMAINLRHQIWHRRNFSGTMASIRALRGQQLEQMERRAPTQWVPAHRSGPCYLFDIARPVSEQLVWLRDIDPDYVMTHPSNLRALLHEAARDGVGLPRLRNVSTLSESLDDDTRALCKRLWGVHVIDVYSCQEAGMIALECPDGDGYHVQAESLLVEILDDNGQSCQPGQVGRIVVTDLHNFATPLIRYEVGDHAEMGEPCSCGRGLPRLRRIVGRTRNMFTLPNGDRFWPVGFWSSEILAIAPVRQIQCVQTTLNSVTVRLGVGRPLAEDEEKRLLAYVSERLGGQYELALEYVGEIARSASGKFEDFVSQVVPPVP